MDIIKFACGNGYTEPSIGVAGRVHCNECKHTISQKYGHRVRTYGIIKGLTIDDPNYAKMCLYCTKQQAYVKPYAWCDLAEEEKL